LAEIGVSHVVSAETILQRGWTDGVLSKEVGFVLVEIVQTDRGYFNVSEHEYAKF
jgi:hypothetical protein